LSDAKNQGIAIALELERAAEARLCREGIVDTVNAGPLSRTTFIDAVPHQRIIAE
jgi:hypothetical protein